MAAGNCCHVFSENIGENFDDFTAQRICPSKFQRVPTGESAEGSFSYAATKAAKYTKELAEHFYETMCTIRKFEESVKHDFLNGEIPGFVHLYIGEEAIATGVCSALRKDDMIESTHRGHGHCVAKGADVNRMMAEIFGKKTGLCQGRGGSMHIADFSVGMLGANGVVGGGYNLATGAALASKMILKNDRVSVVFFGDGAS